MWKPEHRRVPAADVLIDGEAVAHCQKGLPDFHRTLSAAGQREACLLAFDLLAVGGEDVRPLPLLARRKRLEALLAGAPHALLLFSEHMEGPGRRGDVPPRVPLGPLGLEGLV